MTIARSMRRMRFPIVTGVLACCVAGAAAQSPTRRDKPAARDSAFMVPRKFGLGRIPPGALRAAVARMQAQWPQTRTGRTAQMAPGRSFQVSPGSSPSLTAFASTQPWIALGPAPINVGGSLAYTGRINSIALHPTDPLTLYVGTATGGVWKTTNGGASWAPLTDAQCGLAMGSVALDPKNPQIVYAGTGEANFSLDSYQGCGMLVSIDGGATWTNTGTTTIGTSAVSKIIVDTATAGSTSTTVVLAATEGGLFRSANSGTTWTQVKAGVFTDLVASPTAGTYYAAAGYIFGTGSNGVYKSVDDGATWTVLPGTTGALFPAADVGRIGLAVTAATPEVLYATVQNTSTFGLLGVWKSTDGGTTWNSVTATGASCSSQCWYDMYLAVNPARPDTIYFGGFNLYRSTDGGGTFSAITGSTNTVHVDQHALVFDPQRPDTMYIGNDGGIYRTDNGGTTWTTLNTNLAITQFYAGISFNPINASDILGGAQDNGTSEWGGSAAWSRVLCGGGDGAYSAFDHAGTTSYISYTSGSNVALGVARSDNFCSILNSGISAADQAFSEWDIPFVMDPVNSNVLYYGTYKLYRSTNRATSWTAISPILTNGQKNFGISTIAVATADTNTIYAGTGDGLVQVTTNLGATWTKITTGLPLRAITRVVVDPLDPHNAWVTVSGYGTGHVWKTVNAGATWTDISGNLPNAPANALVYQSGSRELDVGTDIGVFSMPFGGSSWTPLAAAMPNVPVADLVYDGPNGRLIAGTHGRGMFTLVATSAVLRGNITNSGTLSALDAQQILAAVVGLPIPGGSIRFPNGDANCDGNITAVDALLVLSKVVGLPTGTSCVGTIH
ncbi:MAG TPA: hypothetical protein VGI97_08080 [Gemmatimonadaceae bacterium]